MLLKGAYVPRREGGHVGEEVQLRAGSSSTPAALAADMRARHLAKLEELRHALSVAGFRVLDEQAKALGLSRSTTWTIIAGKHKTSGLTATIIRRMLAQPQLHPLLRETVLEYVREKSAGRYGHTKAQLRRFSARLHGAECLANANNSAIEAQNI
jgi:hypothetical protein